MRSFAIALLVYAFLIPQHTVAKNNDLDKARYFYDHLAFHEAIPYYERIAVNTTKADVPAQLGDCYRLTGNPGRAAHWYEKAVNLQDCENSVKLHYAQVLMQLMQYDSAAVQLNEYLKTNAADKRAANMLAGCGTAKDMLSQPVAGTVSFLDLNTSHNEFAPTVWNGNLVFTADTGMSARKMQDKWSGRPFCNIYYVPFDVNGNSGVDMKKMQAGKEFNSRYHVGPCTFSSDGNTMYYTRTKYKTQLLNNRSIANKAGEVMLEVMIASAYDPASGTFKSTTSFPYNSSNYSVAYAAVSPDGHKLVFSSDMPGGKGGTDLYLCNSDGKGDWSVPVNAGADINTEGEEVFPFFIDNNTLSFSSDGQQGLGGLDIYIARWDDKKHSFSMPANIGAPFNSSCDDISLAISADQKRTYFSSNRPGDKGGDNIYCFSKETNVKPVIKDHVTEVAVSKGSKNDDSGAIAMPSSVDSSVGARTQLSNEKGMGSDEDAGNTAISKSDKGPDVSRVAVHSDVNISQPKPVIGTNAPFVQTDAQSVKQAKQARAERAKQIYEVGIYKDLRVDKVFEIPGFYFGFNKADIVSGAAGVLDEVYHLLKQNPGLRIQIQAYSDCRGTSAINHWISLQRAAALKNYLVKRGISAARLTCRGYGVLHPVQACNPCNSCGEEQHKKNRRIEFKIIAF